MAALPATVTEQKKDVPLKLINGGLSDKSEYNQVGNIRRTHSNKVAGKSSEVYAFRTKEEIKAMIDVFDKRIADAPDENKEKIACRNKLLFLLGIHLGLRASDLRMLKWSFFYNKNMEFIDGKREIKPKKTRKTNKFVPIFINDSVKTIIQEYVRNCPIDDIDTYIFVSRKKTGRKRKNDDDIKDSQGNMPISEVSIWRILNEVAGEAGIKQNIGSHSLRKTFGYWIWHNAKNKEDALVKLQMIFNHSNTQVTAKYIGITSDEIKDVYNSINLGLIYTSYSKIYRHYIG